MSALKSLINWLYPNGTRLHDLALPFTIIILALFVAAGSWDLIKSQEQDAVIVDFAGRQRMLLQQFLINWRANKFEDAKASIELYRETAQALRSGGKIQSLDLVPIKYDVEPLTKPEIAALLDKQIHIANHLLSQTPDSKGIDVSVNDGFKVTTQTVRALVEKFQTRTRSILLAIFGIFGLLTGTGLWLARLMVERRIRLEQVEKLRGEAVRASEAKTFFLANMSHEIRTPLNAIVGMTDILDNTTLTKEQGRYVQTLRRASDTLLALINDILDLSRIESGQMDLNFHTIDLAELIERTCEVMALRAHQKDLELTCYIAPDIPSFVKTDDTRIRQVLINLIGNAVKFTTAGQIDVRIDVTEKDGRSLLTFSVSDTGIGIPDTKLRSIFDAFTQADSSIAVNYGGTGLGLAISKRIVEMLGGKLSVKSQVGVGSTFSFSLVIDAVEPAMVAQNLSKSVLEGKRILIVDDNSTNRLIVRKYLSETATGIDEAKSGAEALDLVERAARSGRPYDIVLLDYRMPGLNGIDVAERLQTSGQLGSGSIVMLLTSDGRRSDLSNVANAGIAEFLFKPIRRNELIESIGKCLNDSPNEELIEIETKQTSILNRRKHVLIVDDVEDNRFIASSYLLEEGFVVSEASSGEDAIRAVRENRYDLVFMDIRMSPIDGYQATQTIRDLERTQGTTPTKIIALTAHAMKDEIDKAISAGCDAHLTKPITRAKIMSSIRNINLESETSKADGSVRTDAVVPKVEEFLQARLNKYLKNIGVELGSIPNLVAKGEFEKIITLGHNISGTAGIYDLGELSILAHEIEVAAKAKNSDQILDLDRKISNFLKSVNLPT